MVRECMIAGVAVLCYSMTAAAESTTVDLYGKALVVPTPVGYCIPDQSNVGDGNFYKEIDALLKHSSNKLIHLVVECNLLPSHKKPASKAITDYVDYYYPFSAAEGYKSTRKANCDSIREAIKQPLNVQQSVNAAYKELNRSAPTNSTQPLGVLSEDQHGCYFGLLVKIVYGGTSTLRSVMGFSTIIKGNLLYVTVVSEYKNAAESEKQLLQAKSIAADLDKTNPE
jgi:hypothetical protein